MPYLNWLSGVWFFWCAKERFGNWVRMGCDSSIAKTMILKSYQIMVDTR